MKKLIIYVSILLTAIVLSGCDVLTETINDVKHTSYDASKDIPKQEPLNYTKDKQLKFDDLDTYGRPTNSHVQLSYDQKPKKDRNERLEYNPPGWHNYRMTYKKDNGQIGKYWVFDRSHMIGYLFSGVNDEPKNLFMGTVHLNRGSYNGMDSHNEKSMLYYEMKLNNWLKSHPKYKLDYQVTPLYNKDELVPREVRLSYVGYDNNGNQVPINVGSSLETKGNHATVVTLPNEEPNVDINYKTGIAKKQNN